MFKYFKGVFLKMWPNNLLIKISYDVAKNENS